jgi:hypothetical protein
VALCRTVICREQITERPGTARACPGKGYPAPPLCNNFSSKSNSILHQDILQDLTGLFVIDGFQRNDAGLIVLVDDVHAPHVHVGLGQAPG